SSHLYTSSHFIEDFPGRRFQVEAVSSFGKKELKTFLQGMEKANITIRNFPSSVADLRKRLKLKEGGEDYVFATTLADESKILIKCKKVPSVLQELQSC
ncbi:MAG: SAM-dependent methyltransferase, partial [Bacteroides sp.]|nr:SAM-dependent methyltransferase [Bacteroides sp.]